MDKKLIEKFKVKFKGAEVKQEAKEKLYTEKEVDELIASKIADIKTATITEVEKWIIDETAKAEQEISSTEKAQEIANTISEDNVKKAFEES